MKRRLVMLLHHPSGVSVLTPESSSKFAATRGHPTARRAGEGVRAPQFDLSFGFHGENKFARGDDLRVSVNSSPLH